MSKKIIQASKKNCSQAYCFDLETLAHSDFEQFKDADVWVMEGLLERLVDPWSLLEKIRKVMKPEALMVFSISNSQHWSIQAQICLGQLRYQDNTNIDKSYIRLYSRKTIVEILNQAGFKIDNGVSLIKNYYPSRKKIFLTICKMLKKKKIKIPEKYFFVKEYDRPDLFQGPF